ncbi:MAG: TonB-dependent receptor [Bacteroidota bacterium]|nr:TonB-dependent receptor [Bacteroidota bacterium]
MKHYYTSLLFLFSASVTIRATCQTNDSLTVRTIPEITIKAYFHAQSIMPATGSVGIVDSTQLQFHPDNSLVGAVNTVPGVRMEERSPASYRLSIRGSVLRSPFGIRNIRIYVAGMCLTDAGGNTYLNLVSPSDVGEIEILKGPEGSVYGANTGGVILINPVSHSTDSLVLKASGEGGSYGYAAGKIFFQKIFKTYLINASQTYTRSDGYRQNSATQSWTSQIFQRWRYSQKATLKAYLLYTHLYYQTPGGLNITEFNANPRSARPSTATLPGAGSQKAAIYNSTFFGGLSNEVSIGRNLVHSVCASVSYTDFKNPFITNYEKRKETNFDIRTYFDWTGSRNYVKWSWVNGLEAEQILTQVYDYGNSSGVPDTVQTAYHFNAGDYFIFSRFAVSIINRVELESALSLNYNWYQYKNAFPSTGRYTNVGFNPQLMPRVAASVKIIPDFFWRVSASRGYSAPTLAEVHPSANVISKNLQPESGWCYETGFRFREKKGYLALDVATFFYKLDHAISMRSDSAGNDFFINSGGTDQLGFEGQASVWIIRPNLHKVVHNLQLNCAYTFSHFVFSNYYNDNSNYSGHRVTGVPQNVVVSSLNLQLRLGFYLFAEHTYTSRIPLNDANTSFASYYNLLQFKVGWRHRFGKIDLQIFMGANNLLNEKYSLGNDLNAAGQRYYNAASTRNYYAGASIGFSK